MIVEIHVPLSSVPNPPDGASPSQSSWIDQVEDFLVDVEDQGDAEVYDEGEQVEDAYVFFVTGAGEEELLAVASRVALLPGVPAGAFAVVSHEGAEEVGVGRRVELPSAARA
ncbi:hypothetical protein [Streptomyces sp. NPDC003247]|uniref:hypothetical protein n=1 Tax=Streptomyces sp. NPDC003247 TaxID=3364677 RepID=UPI0036919B93